MLAINDEPVAIKVIENAIIDRAFAEGWVRAEQPPHRTGKRVAVIGSGPAGLAAAQQLNNAGHLVTVYEKADRIGGLLRYGIPDFKMEKWVLDRRLPLLEAEGIVFETEYHVGRDISVEQLRERSDAIVLAVGAEAGRDVNVPGRELTGIHLAMDYLIQQNRRVAGDRLLDESAAITGAGKRVVIIGGGDTGADCLGNVIREGCASVQQLYIYPEPPEKRPDDTPWPEWPRILYTYPAHEEGGARDFGTMVTAFSGSDGAVQRVHTQRCGVRRHAGGREFVPEPGTETTIDADLVLLAIGFDGPASNPLTDGLGVDTDRRGNIVVDSDFATSAPGVFAAGDAMRGASLIVWAIADGRIAARSCDRYLMGSTRLP